VPGICVVGSSKTGTTGVYSSVRKGLIDAGRPLFGLHEKYDAGVFANLARNAPERTVLAKMLLTNRAFSADLVASFDDRILIVRDPRDTLVSVMLYHPVLATNRGATDADIEPFVELVRQKEKDPHSTTFLELLVAVYGLMRDDVTEDTDFSRRFNRTIKHANRVPSFLLRYEDFVVDDVDALSAHLGLTVHNTKPSEYSGIVYRTGSSGNWRQWFTPSDVEHFRPMLAEYMTRFDYADDWELPAEPVVDPESGTEYVERAVAKRRAQLAANAAASDDADHLDAQRARADDGSVSAAAKLAAQLAAGGPAPEHRDEVFERAYFAACAGDTGARQLLARCYREGIGVAPDEAKAREWEAAPVVATTSPAPARGPRRIVRGALRRAKRLLSR
jgi:hypothetical protein